MRRGNFALRLQPSLLEELRKADASSARGRRLGLKFTKAPPSCQETQYVITLVTTYWR